MISCAWTDTPRDAGWRLPRLRRAASHFNRDAVYNYPPGSLFLADVQAGLPDENGCKIHLTFLRGDQVGRYVLAIDVVRYQRNLLIDGEATLQLYVDPPPQGGAHDVYGSQRMRHLIPSRAVWEVPANGNP